jgi:hypothetical protein
VSVETEKLGRVDPTEKPRETDGVTGIGPFGFLRRMGGQRFLRPGSFLPRNQTAISIFDCHDSRSSPGFVCRRECTRRTTRLQLPFRWRKQNGGRNSMSCLRHPTNFLFLFDLSSTSETLAHASCFSLCASAVRIPDTGRDGPGGCGGDTRSGRFNLLGPWWSGPFIADPPPPFPQVVGSILLKRAHACCH